MIEHEPQPAIVPVLDELHDTTKRSADPHIGIIVSSQSSPNRTYRIICLGRYLDRYGIRLPTQGAVAAKVFT